MAAFIDLPVKVIFGRNKEDNIGAEVKYFGGSKVLLVYNLRFNQATGVTEKIRRSLEIFGIESVDFAKEFGKNPRVDVIREGIEFARQNYVDFILALGSSHTVNLAKTIALGVANSVDIKEIFTSNRAYKDSLPVGVILTMPGNGVESTGKVYLYENDSDNLLKGSALTNSAYTPRFMILNPEIMNTSSIYTYSSCVYMLGQLIAKYLTSTEYVELLERDTEAIMNIVLSKMRILRNDPANYAAKANLMWAGVLAYNSALDEKIDDCALFSMEKAIRECFDCSPGESLALVMPAWFDYLKEKHLLRVAQFANRVLNIPFNFSDPMSTASLGIYRLKQILKECGLPSCIADMGGDGRSIQSIISHIAFRKDGTIGTFELLDRTACEVILSSLLIKESSSIN
ncbi:MAG TPA: hypothetical protein DCR21_04870 [Succinivibrionaceae bacterium]|nr:hypothetical protein [Succinivibrionaceae bacterium]